MADSSIAITAGAGTTVDTRTEATNGHHRQVVILGDPSTNAGVAPVDATAGLKVDLGADNDITGTVTANLSATDNAVLDAIAADTGTIAGDTTSIDGKLPALGQALAAASVPVVLTAAQITTLTPPAAITGFATSAKQDTIIGHVDGLETLAGTIDADTSNISTKIDTLAGAVTGTEVQVDVLTMPTTTVQATNLDIRDLTSVSDSVAAAQSGTWNITNVSGTVSLPTGASTAAKQPALGTAGTASADVISIQGIASMTPIQVADNGGVLTVDGTVAVTNAGITTIAGAVSGTEMQVDVLTMPTTTVQATNLDIRDLAAASDAVTIHGDVGALDQIDLTNSNPAAVAIVDGNGDQITSFGGGTQYTEGDTDASITGTALMFESNTGTSAVSVVSSSNPLPISDAGGAVTVDGTVAVSSVGGTVAVTQSGTWDEVGINDSGNSITVDYATTGSGTATGALRVELPTNGTGVIATVGAVTAITNALPAGTNAIGKLAANSGVDIGDVDVLSIAAGDNNIGNVDIASIAAGDNNIGNVDLASAIPAGTNAVGKLLPPDVDVTAHTNYARKYYTSAGAATDGIIWSPAAGKRWHVLWLFIQLSADATVTLEDDKAGGDDPVLKGEFKAGSGIIGPFPEKYPLASGEDAADLIITTTAGNVYVTCVGYEI